MSKGPTHSRPLWRRLCRVLPGYRGRDKRENHSGRERFFLASTPSPREERWSIGYHVPNCLSPVNSQAILNGQTTAFEDFSDSCWLDSNLHRFGGFDEVTTVQSSFRDNNLNNHSSVRQRAPSPREERPSIDYHVPKCLSQVNRQAILNGQTTAFEDFSDSCWLDSHLHRFGGLDEVTTVQSSFRHNNLNNHSSVRQRAQSSRNIFSEWEDELNHLDGLRSHTRSDEDYDRLNTSPSIDSTNQSHGNDSLRHTVPYDGTSNFHININPFEGLLSRREEMIPPPPYTEFPDDPPPPYDG